MDFGKILAQLRAEREMIEEAIQSLEKLAGRMQGRGRPPGSISETHRKRGRPKGSRNKQPETAATGTNGSPRF